MVHEFARDVMRPAADHYDRTQETPWDVITAAAEQDLYGINYIQKMGSDPGGLFGVIYAEETHWGCAGIALAMSASSLAAAGIASSGTPEQMGRWCRSASAPRTMSSSVPTASQRPARART